MGIFLVIAMMLYSVGMCLLFQRVGTRSPGSRHVEGDWEHPGLRVDIPDRVPAEWVDHYRA